MLPKTLVAAVLLLVLNGCGESNHQRFVPIPQADNRPDIPWAGALALDTKTGQLCQSYQLRNNPWPDIPNCYGLYKTDP